MHDRSVHIKNFKTMRRELRDWRIIRLISGRLGLDDSLKRAKQIYLDGQESLEECVIALFDEYQREKMMVKITLVDTNLDVVTAWSKEFYDIPNVMCVHGSILDQQTDAWVTPTNSRGNMSGGVDAAIKSRIDGIEEKLKGSIKLHGKLDVGDAVVIPTGCVKPRYVIAAATMVGDSDDISRTKNTALACAAAFQAIYMVAHDVTYPIQSIAIPGLGAGTGKTPSDVCARLMKVGYILFERKRFKSFDEMNDELMALLEEMELIPSSKPKAPEPMEPVGKQPVFPFAQHLIDKYPVAKGVHGDVKPKVTDSQQLVLDALRKESSFSTPELIGMKCGRGIDASKWAWSRLNSLRKKGLVERVGYGTYRAV